ncbi:MAG TPA: enoyl-CoA hydratase/isomerase family protein [Beijerinckia sp.]|jgi:enoyl-CoA hydratase|nr:enoyl-CoA hydratase/isomerase family protein [Beijerinckia sp.]
MSDPEIICKKLGSCGVITLNRPNALNALNLDMVREIARALDAWEIDTEIKSVVIKGAGGKAFCCGGDIKAIYEFGKAGRHEDQLAFWREEYILNRRIKFYPKPYVALLDGIVMGGGAGLSLHGSHRIAGDKFSFAMPEVGIGFFPDIGATYFLPRLPGKLGTYLALTGARLTCGDGVAFGLATAYVPSSQHEALLQKLIAGEDVDGAAAATASQAPDSDLMKQKHFVDGCFGAATLVDILEEIDEAGYGGSMFAMNTYDTIRAKSPLSLSLALRLVQLGAKLDLDEALRMEFRVAARVAMGHDFYEGVRALLIDKDNNPVWTHKEIEAVKPGEIDPYFEPIPGELEFPGLATAP